MKKIRGFCSFVSTATVRMLNLILIVLAAVTAIIIFIVEHWPGFPAGWGLVALSATAALSGFFGIFFVTMKSGCCSFCHHLWMVISTLGLAIAAAFVYFRPDEVMAEIHEKGMDSKSARSWLKANGALYILMTMLQIVIFVFGAIINCCDWNTYYQHNDEPPPLSVSDRQLSDIRQSSSKRSEGKEASKASQLADSMREKYGKWAQGTLDENDDEKV